MKIENYLWLCRQPPMPLLLSLSCIAWSVIFTSFYLPHAAHPVQEGHHSLHSDFSATLVHSEFFLHWLLMLSAMMLPLLYDALAKIRAESLPRNRTMGSLVFLIGYVAFWFISGFSLAFISQILKSNFSALSASFIAISIAILWQWTPWKQHALNRCHMIHRIHPFGARYVIDCFNFGFRKGGWCSGSCWALMLVPMVWESASPFLMVAAGLFMLFEQLQAPRPAVWRIPPI